MITKASAVVIAVAAAGVCTAQAAAANTYACVDFLSTAHKVGYWTGGPGDDFGLGLSSYLTVQREEVCDQDGSPNNYNTAQLQQRNNPPDNIRVSFGSAGIIRRYNEATYAFANGSDLYHYYRFERSTAPVSIGAKLCTRLLPKTDLDGRPAILPVVYDSTCGTPLVGLNRMSFGGYPPPYTDLWYAAASYISSDVPGTPAAKTHFYAMGYGVPDTYPAQFKSYPGVLFGFNDNREHWAYDADSYTSTYMWTYKE